MSTQTLCSLVCSPTEMRHEQKLYACAITITPQRCVYGMHLPVNNPPFCTYSSFESGRSPLYLGIESSKRSETNILLVFALYYYHGVTGAGEDVDSIKLATARMRKRSREGHITFGRNCTPKSFCLACLRLLSSFTHENRQFRGQRMYDVLYISAYTHSSTIEYS